MEGADVTFLEGGKDTDEEKDGYNDGESDDKSEGEILGDICGTFEGPSEMRNGSCSIVMFMMSTSKGIR